jgi:hypothetical protein
MRKNREFPLRNNPVRKVSKTLTKHVQNEIIDLDKINIYNKNKNKFSAGSGKRNRQNLEHGQCVCGEQNF